ncbi:MAG: prenyltransferase [Bdellovibrionaceae bacterium]|nr:prenyltransferase [Pseudobdellovibrionaceae bacterium]
MNPEYVTIRKSDKKFQSYLEGSFSSDFRALPELSLNVNTSREQVTFRLRKISQIKKPSLVILLFKLFRLDWLSLTLGPVLATYSYLVNNHINLDHLSAAVALLAVLFFHLAVFAINDYKDHLTGVDRIQINGGSQVIQKGWMAACSVKKLGILFFSLGSILGSYLIIQQPFFLIAVGVLTAFSVLGYSFYGQGLKYLGFGEFIAFFCFGPLLTYGFSRAAGHFHSIEILALGMGFGYFAAMILLAKQMENIAADSQIGVSSLAVRLGFDKAKYLIEITLIVAPLVLLLTLFFIVKSSLSYFALLPFTYFTVKLYLNFHSVNSSFSSGVDDLRLRVADLHVIYSTLILFTLWLPK